jgi:hypothetical protein
MQIAFVRTGQRYFTEVERDDGAVIRLPGPGKTHPPHDLVHYVVESELGFDRGFWGKTARGEILGKVELVRAPTRKRKPARKPPRRVGVAVEPVVGLVTRIHGMRRRDRSSVEATLSTWLTPSARARAGLDPDALILMCRRLDELAARWAATPHGGRLVLSWPPEQSPRRRVR